MDVGWRVLVAVAVGGTIGAAARWMAGLPFDVGPAEFPISTLLVNLAGCATIGMLGRRLRPDTTAWAFAVTGVLGGFTTMSAFAQELNDLAEADRSGAVAAYLVATLAGGIVALVVAERATPAR